MISHKKLIKEFEELFLKMTHEEKKELVEQAGVVFLDTDPNSKREFSTYSLPIQNDETVTTGETIKMAPIQQKSSTIGRVYGSNYQINRVVSSGSMKTYRRSKSITQKNNGGVYIEYITEHEPHKKNRQRKTENDKPLFYKKRK